MMVMRLTSTTSSNLVVDRLAVAGFRDLKLGGCSRYNSSKIKRLGKLQPVTVFVPSGTAEGGKGKQPGAATDIVGEGVYEGFSSTLRPSVHALCPINALLPIYLNSHFRILRALAQTATPAKLISCFLAAATMSLKVEILSRRA